MTTLTQQLAKHLRDIHFGGNWTCTNMRDTLKDITWQQALTKVYDMNTIATLTCHTTYYVRVLLDVLEGRPLVAKDEYSFDVPPISSAHDWEQLLEFAWQRAEQAAQLLEKLPDSVLLKPFTDEKYGNYYRNIQGNIEHMHYHLGQIVIIKKLLMKYP